MTIRSYVVGKALSFAESEVAPIHLAEIDGRHYYAFAEKQEYPTGSKAAADDDALALIYKHSQLIKQIKEEAARRILAIAPQWKQQNALADIYLLGKLKALDEKQTERLQKADALLQSIQDIRLRSDEIEASFLNGIAVEYLTDQAWGV
jgi:DNA polymerase III alpha subunit